MEGEMDLLNLELVDLVRYINREIKKHKGLNINQLCAREGVSKGDVKSRLQGSYKFDKKSKQYIKQELNSTESNNSKSVKRELSNANFNNHNLVKQELNSLVLDNHISVKQCLNSLDTDKKKQIEQELNESFTIKEMHTKQDFNTCATFTIEEVNGLKKLLKYHDTKCETRNTIKINKSNYSGVREHYAIRLDKNIKEQWRKFTSNKDYSAGDLVATALIEFMDKYTEN